MTVKTGDHNTPKKPSPRKPHTSMTIVRVTIELMGFNQLSSSECNKCPLKKTCEFGRAREFTVIGCTIPVNVAIVESIARGITGVRVKFRKT